MLLTAAAALPLMKLLMGPQMTPDTPENARLARRHTFPMFLDAIQLDPWTVRALPSATKELESLVLAGVGDLLQAAP